MLSRDADACERGKVSIRWTVRLNCHMHRVCASDVEDGHVDIVDGNTLRAGICRQTPTNAVDYIDLLQVLSQGIHQVEERRKEEVMGVLSHSYTEPAAVVPAMRSCRNL